MSGVSWFLMEQVGGEETGYTCHDPQISSLPIADEHIHLLLSPGTTYSLEYSGDPAPSHREGE